MRHKLNEVKSIDINTEIKFKKLRTNSVRFPVFWPPFPVQHTLGTNAQCSRNVIKYWLLSIRKCSRHVSTEAAFICAHLQFHHWARNRTWQQLQLSRITLTNTKKKTPKKKNNILSRNRMRIKERRQNRPKPKPPKLSETTANEIIPPVNCVVHIRLGVRKGG